MLVYSFGGRFATRIMTNSSWTNAHMLKLWGKPHQTQIVYPPCDTSHITSKVDILAEERRKKIVVISFAQFRPEKDHTL